MTIRHVRSNDVRVPAVVPGESVIVDRYRSGNPKAVIVHPDDFALLQAVRAIIDEPVELDPLPFSDLALELHLAGERGTDEFDDDIASMLAALEE